MPSAHTCFIRPTRKKILANIYHRCLFKTLGTLCKLGTLRITLGHHNCTMNDATSWDSIFWNLGPKTFQMIQVCYCPLCSQHHPCGSVTQRKPMLAKLIQSCHPSSITLCLYDWHKKVLMSFNSMSQGIVGRFLSVVAKHYPALIH